MANCSDSWLGKDKVKHFIVCFVLSLIFPLIAITLAIWKEVNDERQANNHFCWKDMAADAVGTLLGSAVFFCWFIKVAG